MQIGIIYYSQTGSTKKLADGLGEALGIEPIDISKPHVLKNYDMLFVGCGTYNDLPSDMMINYINKIGIDNIEKYVLDLRQYAIEKMLKLKNIEIYNKNIKSSTIVFNVKGVFSQDTSTYLNKNGINVRAGNHCAKILKDEIGVTNTCRISFYFYNTKEEVDALIKVLEEEDILLKSLI